MLSSVAITPVRLQDSGYQHINTLEQLYTTSFPEHERRSFAQLLQLLPEPDMYVHALELDGHAVGLSIHWQFKDFLYLEHLAIAPERRGQRLGQQAMQWLLKQANSRLVLEVEPPTDEITRKRIAFYERLGLVHHAAFAYRQPPYLKGGTAVPLHLMTSHTPASVLELDKVAADLRQQVYERFYI